MSLARFPREFVWGAATASYQIEGAPTAHGKEPSIWDAFVRRAGAIENGDTGDVACDHVRLWREDVALMRELGLNGYRFSVSWPRALTEPGLDFYDRLVDALLENGIRPFVTLYHWDLPQRLQERGGWDAPETTEEFVAYAARVDARLGDRVHDWITINEPNIHAFVGHGEGLHAPGLRDRALAFRVVYALMEAHAAAREALRGQVGIALNLAPVHAATPAHQDEAANIDRRANTRYLERVAGRTDFVGVNYYSRNYVGAEPPGERTATGWEVYPDGLREVLLRVHGDVGVPIYVTENGAAVDDDAQRLAFLRDHLAAAADAIAAGVDLRGYFVWSLLDNFEWHQGFAKRFGIVEVDYATQRRTVRASGRWYQELIAQWRRVAA